MGVGDPPYVSQLTNLGGNGDLRTWNIPDRLFTSTGFLSCENWMIRAGVSFVPLPPQPAALAQMAERPPCKRTVEGSNPSGSSTATSQWR